MGPLTILDLPNELLLQLAGHLHNIEDIKNVSSTCRRLYAVLADTLPKTILRLAAKSAPTFFSPHPHFLVLSVARQLATWVVAVEEGREEREKKLVEAFRGGAVGLLDLALDDSVEGVGLTMPDVRNMHLARFSVINPLNETLDAMIGSAWYAQPNFWSGGAEDAFTLYADVSSATMQLLIYSELFGPTMQAYLEPTKNLPKLSVDTRIEFVKYCIPDWICKPPTHRHDGFKVESVGPYAPDPEGADGQQLEGNQTALAHLLGGAMFEGKLWKRAWRRVLVAAGAESNEDGKWPTQWIERLQKIQWRQRGKKYEGGEVAVDREGDVVDSDGEAVFGNVSTGQVEAREQAVRDAEGGQERGEDENEENGSDNDEEAGDEDGDNNEANEGEENGEDGNEDEDEEWTYSSVSSSKTSTPEDWRFTLFWNALTTTSDLSTFSMVAQFKGREEGCDVVMKPEWKAKIIDVRDQVLALEDNDDPGYKKYGKRRNLRVSEAPDLADEAYWCCAGMWGGL